jgi:uncharacterized membrane protein YbhN (UPF0104 family)
MAVSAGAIGVLVTLPRVGGSLTQGIAGLHQVRPIWAAAAAALFFVMFVAMSLAWRVAFAARGSTLTLRDACARYGIGSLVNTVAPFRLGDAARVAAFARAIDEKDAVWVAGGALGAIELARICSIVALVGTAWALGAVPFLWLAVGLGILGALVAVVSIVARRRPERGHTRVARLLVTAQQLARSPRDAGRLLAAVGVAGTARVFAAVSICSALGISSPMVAGLLIVVALELSGQLQLTPANIGITNGAVAVALTARGVGLDEALTAGIALQAVETLVGVAFGVAGVLSLLGARRVVLRRWIPVAAALVGCAAIVTVAGLGIVGDLS